MGSASPRVASGLAQTHYKASSGICGGMYADGRRSPEGNLNNAVTTDALRADISVPGGGDTSHCLHITVCPC